MGCDLYVVAGDGEGWRNAAKSVLEEVVTAVEERDDVCEKKRGWDGIHLE